MKKLVLILSVATLAISCKKVAEGGNQGVLRIEKGADRYDAHETRKADTAAVQVRTVPADSTSAAQPAVGSADSLRQVP